MTFFTGNGILQGGKRGFAVKEKEDAVMAKTIEAIRANAPRVKRELTAELVELVGFIAGRSSMNEGAVLNVLTELREAVTFFASSGRPVRLRGLGVFAPTIDLEGKIKIKHRTDKHLLSELNVDGRFNGEIVNRDMIGKATDDLVDRWNEEHPRDKVKKKKK